MKNESPFLDIRSFVAEEVLTDSHEASVPMSSPFLSLYEYESGGVVDPEAEAYVAFLNELHDEEFDEALTSLVDEARALYESHFPHEQEDPRTTGYQAERLLNQHFAPLIGEVETLFESLSREFNQRDPNSLSEGEIESMFERYQPSASLSPHFEQFWGAIKKAAKKAVSLAKKGISAAATLGLGPILNKLKGLIKPLLKRVIQTAIGKLPEKLQPLARQLQEKIPFLKEFDVDEFAAEDAQVWEITELQYEFNQEVANLLFAHTEAEQDLEIARVLNEAVPDAYPMAELEQARERFVEDLHRLKEGESPTPHIENFFPALIPALKLGLKIVGRKRVVDFLAKFLGKLLQKFVGPQNAPALSQAIVDAGLRLIHLEATPEDESRAAASAVAATVEETVQRVAALPEYVLDNQELLEGFALEAFEQAAAANLPPVLPEETYKKRPDLGEARKLRGVWAIRPGLRRRRYKKYSRAIRTHVAPHQLTEIETLDGIPLSGFLEEQLGMEPGEEAEAIVHLYEAIPGTHLSDIVRNEELIPKLNGATGHDLLHPLTREAAAMLTGEPELGRDLNASHASDPQSGQRFYYLEIPGKRPLTVPGPAGKTQVRRATRTKLILDFSKNEVRMYLFLGEIRAQEIAVKLRQHAHIGMVVAGLRKRIQGGINKAFNGRPLRLKIIHEAVIPGRWSEALKRLPSVVHQTLKGRLTEWIVKGLADQLKQRADEFKKAAEDTADGITLVVTLENPPGFSQIRDALKAKGISPGSLQLPDGEPKVTIVIQPGYKNE